MVYNDRHYELDLTMNLDVDQSSPQNFHIQIAAAVHLPLISCPSHLFAWQPNYIQNSSQNPSSSCHAHIWAFEKVEVNFKVISL